MVKNVLSAVALTLMTALPVSAEGLSLNQISAYLNGLGQAQARFDQINADGSVSTGQLYLHRPGRMRFEYDPPNPALVIAGGGQVAIFDDKGDDTPEGYPLRRTPLRVILDRQVNLANSPMVVGHQAQGDLTYVLARDPENPDTGTIQLVFTNEPVALQQWIIINGAGEQTNVLLDDLAPVSGLSQSLFNIKSEKDRRSDRG